MGTPAVESLTGRCRDRLVGTHEAPRGGRELWWFPSQGR